jgi:hypothetical protein
MALANMPRGGITSQLEEYAEQLLPLNRERRDFTLDETSWRCTSGELPEVAARSPDFSRHDYKESPRAAAN